MILDEFFSIYQSFFDSTFFSNILIYPISLGLILSTICLIWHIIRGY